MSAHRQPASATRLRPLSGGATRQPANADRSRAARLRPPRGAGPRRRGRLCRRSGRQGSQSRCRSRRRGPAAGRPFASSSMPARRWTTGLRQWCCRVEPRVLDRRNGTAAAAGAPVPAKAAGGPRAEGPGAACPWPLLRSWTAGTPGTGASGASPGRRPAVVAVPVCRPGRPQDLGHPLAAAGRAGLRGAPVRGGVEALGGERRQVQGRRPAEQEGLHDLGGDQGQADARSLVARGVEEAGRRGSAPMMGSRSGVVGRKPT